VTTDQVFVAAIVAVVLIFTVVGVGRAMSRRRGSNEDRFGAGGVSRVDPGTTGTAKTALAPDGVVLAAGEQWTARSRSGTPIPAGQDVRVVGQEGLTLIVDPEPAPPRAGE
jgi:membrane-bound ClpP family serine protease